jgi:DNA-binding GntR family transcriptional regulator
MHSNQQCEDQGAGDEGSRAGHAYQVLRREIVAARIPPGARLTEPDLTERFGIGKASLRVALGRLRQEGFVTSLPRQGYLVAPVTLRDVEEVFALRLALEPLAARLAAGRVDRAQLEALERACRQRIDADIPAQIDRFLDANRAFHMAIAEASGNRRLVRMLSELMDEMSRLVALGFGAEGERPNIENDHRALIEHLVKGDGEAAARLAQTHVETFRAMTLAKVTGALQAASIDTNLPRLSGARPSAPVPARRGAPGNPLLPRLSGAAGR